MTNKTNKTGTGNKNNSIKPFIISYDVYISMLYAFFKIKHHKKSLEE